jgi:hypothetical protein
MGEDPVVGALIAVIELWVATDPRRRPVDSDHPGNLRWHCRDDRAGGVIRGCPAFSAENVLQPKSKTLSSTAESRRALLVPRWSPRLNHLRL